MPSASPSKLFLLLVVSSSLSQLCWSCLAGIDRGQALINFLGGSTTVVPLEDGRKGQAVCNLDDLQCNFNGIPCQWGPVKKSDNSWFVASGQPDTIAWTTATGTPSTPSDQYAIVPVLIGVDSDWLVSDPIGCQADSEGIVTLDYWLTGTSKFKVCAVTDDSALTDIFCSSNILQTSPGPPSPGPISISITGPINQRFRIAIKPNGGTSGFGFVAVDNLVYSTTGDFCPGCTTTTEIPTTTAPPSFPALLGGGVNTNPWPDHRKGSAINSGNDISCGFDDSKPCRYGSDGTHNKAWQLVTGLPDATTWKSQTGSATLPNSPFLGIDLRGPGDPDWFLSDPGNCQSSSAVTYRLWLTSDATLKVCTVTTAVPHTIIACAKEHTQADTPGPIKDVISGPGGSTKFLVAFIPKGGGYAAVDSITYVPAGLCAGTAPTPTPAPTPAPFCNAIPCSFNAGNCAYNLQGAGATKPFVMSSGRNPQIGCAQNTKVIPDSGTGAFFIGTNITLGEKAVLESPSVKPTGTTTFSARIYMATYGGQVQLCTGFSPSTNSHTGCQVLTGLYDFSVENYGWKKVQVTLPAQTSKVYLVGTMEVADNSCVGLGVDQLTVTSGC